MINQRRCADLRNQFFLAVIVAAKVGEHGQTIKAAAVSCGVDKLMERGAVIRCAFRKLCQQWKDHAVCAGLIIRPVSLSVLHLHARALHIATYDGFGVLVCAGRLRQGLGVSRRQPFALVDVEHAVIAQKGNGFLFAPYPVTIRLYQNGVGMEGRTLTLGEGAWSGSFEDLPAENADGQPYEYTIREIINGRPHGDGDVFAYGETHTAVSVAGSQQEGYVVTNSLWKAGLVAVPVYKTWDLGPGMSGYPVAFELYRHVQGEDASGAVRVENPVCDYGGPYQVEFRDLPKYDGAGRSYVYTVREVVGGESYTDGDVFASPGGGTTAVSIAPAESGGYVVRNVVRRDGELLSIPVRKVWRGGTGAGVTVQLYRGTEGDEKMEGRVLLLGEHNGWEGVFENLQRHDAAGRACTYTVREVVEGVSYGDGDRFVAGGALIRLSIEGDETSGFTVINTVESTKGPPMTGVTSPAALAGAGLLASVAGMSAAWLALRRRRRGEEKPGN